MTANDYSGTRRPEAKPGGLGIMKPILIAMAVLGLLAFLGLMGLGFAVEKGYFPNGTVTRGSELSGRIKGQLEEHVLEPGETALLFASVGPLSIWDDGQLLTDKRVVSWITDVRETPPDVMELSNISQISAEFESGMMGFTQVNLYGPDDENGDYEAIHFMVNSERYGDVYFVKGIATEAIRVGADLEGVYVEGDITEERLKKIPRAERYESEPDPDPDPEPR